MLDDEELSQELMFKFSRRPSLKQIEFAASVIYKAPKDPKDAFLKRHYYSLEEMKISSHHSKQHDKRYEEVRENIHDGSPKSIFRILVRDYASGLERYLYAEAVREWAIEQEGMWMEMAAEYVGWTEDRDETHAIRNAMDACQNIIESRRLLSAAKSALENCKRRIKRKATAAVPVAETAVNQ